MVGQTLTSRDIRAGQPTKAVTTSLQGTADVVSSQLATINARLSNIIDTLRGDERPPEPVCDTMDRSEMPLAHSINTASDRVAFANKQLDELQQLLFGW